VKEVLGLTEKQKRDVNYLQMRNSPELSLKVQVMGGIAEFRGFVERLEAWAVRELSLSDQVIVHCLAMLAFYP